MRASVPLFFLWIGLVGALTSCAEEEAPFGSSLASNSGEAGALGDASAAGPGTCLQASAAMPLPQRLVTMGSSASDAGADASSPASADSVFLVSDLWQMYETSCGGPCHDHGAPGGFSLPNVVAFASYPPASWKIVLQHIMSNGPTAGTNPLSDPVDPMPPFSNGGKAFSTRASTDPVVLFASLLQQWGAQGYPTNSFMAATMATASAGPSQQAASFTLSRSTADSLTLIGDCVPNKALYAPEEMQSANAALDAMFARAAQNLNGATASEQLGLPALLSQTDLFTLDSAVLAQHGVIGYSPAYPLWADNMEGGIETGKLRYVRVPLGKPIQFDKATQQFTIPPNTRFYKTFMKRIVDVDGSYRYRKMETRVIVSRPDVNPPSGNPVQTALYATYKWREDESDADIESSSLNDGHPFQDDLFTYVKDEQLSPIIRAQNPGNPDAAEIAAGSRKHYAIPSSQRCVECHMGSPSQSFILGFSPVQINRRPVGQGGIVEPVGADELTQLQRLIDLGVVAGMNSPSDVLPLEQLEGARAPRNDYELRAQGYMVGNCQHCHNPRGYPSVQFPVLQSGPGELNFLPGPDGGIFQFPLEKFSARIARGPSQDKPIPYISPSLVDLPPDGWETAGPAAIPTVNDPAYGPKYVISSTGVSTMLFAPWRSLIFRNVKTPFTYSEDSGLFPHMPMNTPGYDVNVGEYMADWMVSIPSVRKNPQIAEYGLLEYRTSALDNSPQPYVEVSPGDPGYAAAVAAANDRLNILHTGMNPQLAAENMPVNANDTTPIALEHPFSYYSYTPDTSDIRDPVVEVSVCQTVPSAPLGTSLELTAVSTTLVPDHAHWVITDLTEPQGPWGPRRGDWYSVLIPGESGTDGGTVASTTACGDTSASATAARVKEQEVAVGVLQGVKLTDDFRAFATTAVPFGLWQNKPGCTFDPKVAPPASSFPSATQARPQWMDNPASNVQPTDPVYMQWPGQAVFNMICINCHGSNFDGTGRLADNLLTISGGTVRVADLHDGIFGPSNQPGANRQAIFGDAALAAKGVNAASDPNWACLPGQSAAQCADDRAVRYLAWMGLGGTTAIIPNSILNIVADTSVLGVHRSLPSSAISANMLSAAKALCGSVLANDPKGQANISGYGTRSVAYSSDITGAWFLPDINPPSSNPAPPGVYLKQDHNLITANGDAELWMRLCSIDNPPPVRVGVDGSDIFVSQTTDDDNVTHLWSTDLVRPSVYGAFPVGNDRGKIDPAGIDSSNLRPWCVVGSTDPATLPECPANVAAAASKFDAPANANITTDAAKCADGSSACTGANCVPTPDCLLPSDADAWATRGAINAGLAVFVYLDAVVKAQNNTAGAPVPPPALDYTQCAQLP